LAEAAEHEPKHCADQHDQQLIGTMLSGKNRRIFALANATGTNASRQRQFCDVCTTGD